MHRHRKDQPDPDISWRTKELGPEMRRSLFRKAVPWVKLASEDGRRGQAQGQADEGDRPRPAPGERR